jgi:hypothetical protein
MDEIARRARAREIADGGLVEDIGAPDNSGRVYATGQVADDGLAL